MAFSLLSNETRWEKVITWRGDRSQKSGVRSQNSEGRAATAATNGWRAGAILGRAALAGRGFFDIGRA